MFVEFKSASERLIKQKPLSRRDLEESTGATICLGRPVKYVTNQSQGEAKKIPTSDASKIGGSLSHCDVEASSAATR